MSKKTEVPIEKIKRYKINVKGILQNIVKYLSAIERIFINDEADSCNADRDNLTFFALTFDYVRSLLPGLDELELKTAQLNFITIWSVIRFKEAFKTNDEEDNTYDNVIGNLLDNLVNIFIFNAVQLKEKGE